MLWTLILVGVWFLIYGLTGVEAFFPCRVIRSMNNAIRQDIAEILLRKSYRSFHEQSVGEYLSQFTNDISQIENLAWNPFFNCIRSADGRTGHCLYAEAGNSSESVKRAADRI